MFVQVYGPMHLDTANCYRSVHSMQWNLWTYSDSLLSSLPHISSLLLLLLLSPRHLARIEYMLNDMPKALSNQHKATLILERVLGVDHPETITAYINLALHSHANSQPAVALRLLYRWGCGILHVTLQ